MIFSFTLLPVLRTYIDSLIYITAFCSWIMITGSYLHATGKQRIMQFLILKLSGSWVVQDILGMAAMAVPEDLL